MVTVDNARFAAVLLAGILLSAMHTAAIAAIRIEGQVQAGNGPLASSTVTLWAASAKRCLRSAAVRAWSCSMAWPSR